MEAATVLESGFLFTKSELCNICSSAVKSYLYSILLLLQPLSPLLIETKTKKQVIIQFHIKDGTKTFRN